MKLVNNRCFFGSHRYTVVGKITCQGSRNYEGNWRGRGSIKYRRHETATHNEQQEGRDEFGEGSANDPTRNKVGHSEFLEQVV